MTRKTIFQELSSNTSKPERQQASTPRSSTQTKVNAPARRRLDGVDLAGQFLPNEGPGHTDRHDRRQDEQNDPGKGAIFLEIEDFVVEQQPDDAGEEQEHEADADQADGFERRAEVNDVTDDHDGSDQELERKLIATRGFVRHPGDEVIGSWVVGSENQNQSGHPSKQKAARGKLRRHSAVPFLGMSGSVNLCDSVAFAFVNGLYSVWQAIR